MGLTLEAFGIRQLARHELQLARGNLPEVAWSAGWHRLRLLREILDELVPGVEQFLLVDDVSAMLYL